jgi:hypothetical protein
VTAALRYRVAAVAVIAMAVAILLWMGRPPICTCGTVKLWAGAVNSADNSQHIADWYTPSHILHGFLFYGLGWILLRRGPLDARFLLAVAIEAGWEVLENTPVIIDRYRQTTAALGYTGDSVLNSVADIGWMSLGFLLAGRLPLGAIIALFLGFELLTLWTIRDNLTLNVLMLLAPSDAIRAWQAG